MDAREVNQGYGRKSDRDYGYRPPPSMYYSGFFGQGGIHWVVALLAPAIVVLVLSLLFKWLVL